MDGRDRDDGAEAAPGLSRRALITGAGAGAALLAAGVAGAQSAQAAPADPDDVGHRAAHPAVTASIGSAPISGYTYRVACMYDFRPFSPNGQVTWGGYGVYTAGATSALRAIFDVPPGVLIRDFEWYVYNSSGASVNGDLLLFTAGSGALAILSSVTIPSTGSTSAVRLAVPSQQQGPFAVGSKLLASVTTPTNSTVQVNAVRLGFSQGQAAAGLLPTPVRAYDSRVTGGKLAAGSTRTVTLPASIVVPGVTGVLVNITATGGRGGFLKVYPGNASAPSASTINFGTASIANAIAVGVSGSRQIKVYASSAVHVIVDITGTLS